jgi:hypothetical protein
MPRHHVRLPAGIDNGEIIETVLARGQLMNPVRTSLPR